MMNLLSGFMANIKPTSKMTVGVSVSQSGLLEVCIVDKVNYTIKNYANRKLKYNAQLREIENIEEFKTQLISIYQELDIIHNSSVILLLPNAFLEITSVPLILDNYSIESVLLGNVEQSYLFKKNNPLLSWVELGQNNRNDNRSILYSAIQENEVLKYLAVFESFGAQVLAVGNSHFNLISSIKHTKICKREIDTQSPWNTVLITNNSFAIFSMAGDKLVEFNEEPVALRSLTSEEEIYSVLVDSINSSLQNYIANSLLIISDNDDIDASVIAERIPFHGEKHYLNQNKYATGQIIDTNSSILPNYISQITLYSVSCAFLLNEDSPKINFSVNEFSVSSSKEYSISIAGVDIDITKEMITAFVIAILVVIIVSVALFLGIFKFLNNSNLKKIEELDNNITTISQQIGDLKSKKQVENKNIFDIGSAKKKISDNNKKEILYFNALSFNIPSSTWLTHFYVDANGAVAIEGKTSSTNNVYAFFKSVKTLIEDSNISLAKLKYATGYEEEILKTSKLLYEFELSNPEYASTDVSKLENIIPKIPEVVEESDTDEKGKEGSKKAEVPNLPPIENIKGKVLDMAKKELNIDDKNNASKEEKGTKSQENLDLPELPNFDN